MFNRRSNRIDDILDDCLDRILVRSESIDDCLALYRRYADELKPLLQTAITARKAVAFKPRPDFKARARYQFHAALKEASSRKRRRFFGWQMRWVTMASLSLVLLFSSGGVIAAASNSMPNSPLYQVKLATEQIQLFLTFSPEDKSELHAKLADRRVDEIVYMAKEDNVRLVELTTDRLQNHLSMITSISIMRMDGVVFEGVLGTQTETTVTSTVTTTTWAGGVLTDEISETVPAPATAPAEDIVPTILVPGITTTIPTESQGKDFSLQLRQQSDSNMSALIAALETASEEVKPALIEAIAVLESGYNDALNAIGE